MKRITYIINCTLVLILLSTVSCSDDFLSIVPEDAQNIQDIIKTPADAQKVLNSAYDALGFINDSWLLSELTADQIENRELTGDWAAHYSRTTDIFLGTTRGLMQGGYRPVARALNLLENIDLAQGLTATEKDRMTGEVLFIRAICHFEMVRAFAHPHGYTSNNTHLGVPIRLDYGLAILPRATVAAVYDQIIADLSAASLLLPAENGFYATSWSAKAYLAKVYFQMNEFQKAYDTADDVITNGPVTMLDPDLMNRFSENGTSEAYFQLSSTNANTDNSGGGIQSHYRLNPVDGVPAIYPASNIYSLARASNSDLRGQLWFETLNAGEDNEITYVTKFEQSTSTPMNVPLAHLTEIKLIRGESAAELGTNLDQAADDISDIRERAGLVGFPTGTSAEVLIASFRQERRLELMFEGNRLHELKRQAVNDSPNLTIRGAAWDCPGMIYQIPDSELSGNLDMIPNEEGGCN